jgi:hypothetical protein
MEIGKIHHHATGYLNNSKYTTGLLELLSLYKDKFGKAENLTLYLEEFIPISQNSVRKKVIIISENGKEITINLEQQKYQDKSGKFTLVNTPEEISISLHKVMKKAVIKYTEQFSPKGPEPIQERVMLEEPTKSWMVAVKKAMTDLHLNFKNNPRAILTESDLKCWVFLELKKVENAAFSVHTEITHYAEHFYNDEIVVKKYKFRDLSLLTPSAIIDNEKFLSEGGEKKEILTKGFKHKAPAIHFELKFIRQGNNLNSLESDITKLNEYYPDPETAERKFVVVWGSRCSIKNIGLLKREFDEAIKKLTNHNIKPLIEFYLFDVEKLIHIKWEKDIFKCKTL